MKKLMTMLVLAASVVTGVNAWEISVGTNSTHTMIAPPAQDYSVGITQIQPRSPTNAVNAGELRRIGDTVIIAANSGVTTSAVPTAVSWTTGGVYITYAQLSVIVTNGATDDVTTNFTYAVGPITIPTTGLSAFDGTNVANAVYWYRVPRSRTSLILQPAVLETAKSMYYEDANGDSVIGPTIGGVVELRGFNGVLYGHSSGTSGVVNVFQIP